MVQQQAGGNRICDSWFIHYFCWFQLQDPSSRDQTFLKRFQDYIYTVYIYIFMYIICIIYILYIDTRHHQIQHRAVAGRNTDLKGFRELFLGKEFAHVNLLGFCPG